MRLSIHAHLSYTTQQPCDVLLQIEAAQDETQRCEAAELKFASQVSEREIAGEFNVGTRRWLRAGPVFECDYTAQLRVNRQAPHLETLLATPLRETPSDVTGFLMPSRYCHPEFFADFVPQAFAGQSGGALIAAMCDWIARHFTYDSAASDAGTTAQDSFARRAGVCRDYAHVLIAMARAAGVPARIVSAYAPDVTPQDFHAVVEVYLQGTWHLVDPTGMAQPSEIARIGVGRDAADVSFMTSYGWMVLKKQAVTVRRITS